MKLQTDTRARAISQKLFHDNADGFDFDSIFQIITSLIGVLIDCFDPDDGGQAQEYVIKRFTGTDENPSYKRSLWRTTARQVKRAARKRGRRLTWKQSRVVAMAVLEEIRTGDPQVLSLVIREGE